IESPETEILWAAEHGHLDIVIKIIEEHPQLVNTKDKDGYSPLHRACYSNHIDIVDYLLLHGADISSKTEMQWQPLHSCCQWNHKEIASRLLQMGADVNAVSSGKQTPLHIAASHGKSYDMVQLLLIQPFINPHLKNNSGETAYDIAKRSSKYYKIFEMADSTLDN
ncbi:ankyrin repeat domain-containing protein 49-like, partial [Atheta coriaria]|uniref:ankyrin repeat domain-containing protein 49-like n=1 Tax=Dalotia coriaria TaxID=877792 RepID=UPI0031F3DCEF